MEIPNPIPSTYIIPLYAQSLEIIENIFFLKSTSSIISTGYIKKINLTSSNPYGIVVIYQSSVKRIEIMKLLSEIKLKLRT